MVAATWPSTPQRGAPQKSDSIVEEDYQDKGIATRILNHRPPATRGADQFEAERFSSMLAVFSRSGLPMKQSQGVHATRPWLTVRPGPG